MAPISQVYHPLDLVDPMEYRNLGVWQASLDRKVRDQTRVTAAVFPVFQDYKVPGSSSRWQISTQERVESYARYYYGTRIDNSNDLQNLAAGRTLVSENDWPDRRAASGKSSRFPDSPPLCPALTPWKS